MLFGDLDQAPADPVLGMATLFAADRSPHKIDLGIGIYRDGRGQAPVMRAVKAAELRIVQSEATKAYLSSAGNPDFNAATAELVLGRGHGAISAGRVRTVQTPGGTGALRVAADFLKQLRGAGRIWIPDPSWPNHGMLFPAAGLKLARYPYYDDVAGAVRFDDLCSSLAAADPNDIVVIHACCHNPTGADLSEEQWRSLAGLLQRRRLIPLVDMAYQGFGAGLEADAFGPRLLAQSLPEVLVASSYSKNFAMYRERVGALTLICAPGVDADNVRTHLMRTIRTNYSMPPNHGAAVVAVVLGDPELRGLWLDELEGMRARLRDVRRGLAERLAGRTRRDYGFLDRGSGMFASLGLTPRQCVQAREDFHLHMSGSGRINVAGLTTANLDHAAEALIRLESLQTAG